MFSDFCEDGTINDNLKMLPLKRCTTPYSEDDKVESLVNLKQIICNCNLDKKIKIYKILKKNKCNMTIISTKCT